MRIFQAIQTRREYLESQIQRSNIKFAYCKVSVEDVRRYGAIIAHDTRLHHQTNAGPVLCLGTRNGREVDLFRQQWFGNPVLAALSGWLEQHAQSFVSRLPLIEAIGRSSLQRIGATSVIGVEINPRAIRSDVWVGSFDEMPADWARRFGVVYSNSFDQSEDPLRTAREWARVIRPGGYLIFCFADNEEPTETDRVGGLNLDDVLALIPGRLVHFCDRGSANGYSEAIIQLTRLEQPPPASGLTEGRQP
jgi:SAM-dependent methyltransferase